jgi:hypothetical protein
LEGIIKAANYLIMSKNRKQNEINKQMEWASKRK